MKNCIMGYDMIVYPNSTVTDCVASCDAVPNCKAIVFGVLYGGDFPEGYGVNDCILQDSSDISDCYGTYYNHDVYIRTSKGKLVNL